MNLNQFFECTYFFGEHFFHLINDFIDDEVNDSDISKEPRFHFAFLLKNIQYRLDFFLPIVSHTMLTLYLRIRTLCTFSSYHQCPQITPSTKTVDFGFVLGITSEHFSLPNLLNYVSSHSKRSRCDEIFILEKREVPNDPIFCLIFFKLAPLIWVEKPIFIRKMQKFTEETRDLCLGPEWVIGNNNWMIGVFDVHFY